ncbi:MAG: VWA domain-containing protein, partial [Myxococcales bacterium]|nr:VWA domain-containing protein [Myxococcales bacterium]
MIDPKPPEREAFLDDLAAVAAGEQAAVDRHIDLLTDDDAMRDLRHDANGIAGELRAQGEDYNHSADFAARLQDRLDAFDAEQDSSSSEDKEPPGQASNASNESAKVQDDLAKARTEKPTKPSHFRSVLLATGAAAAAALLMVVGAQTGSSDSKTTGATETAVAAASESVLSAKLIQTERSANDGVQGLTVLFPETGSNEVAVGSLIPAGSTVRTDSRTRAILQLSDTSTITLAPSSELLLDRKAARTLSLLSGELFADVAHLDNGPRANYLLPTGRVEVLGTKFALSAGEQEASVRVLRGRIALYGTGSESHQVNAGEEGSVSSDGAIEVTPALHLADSVRWSELGPRPAEDRSGSGLGELRAYKPGQSRDRDWPMALQNHKVTVRLVGNVARTEIEETFRNDSKTVLEGVYKFPLPAGAQIDKLALDVDGRFEEGAIVDKDRAKKIWAGVIAKATTKRPNRPIEMIWVPGPWRDPAILEWQQGNRFELRIFPIPAQGTRTIKLAYTQTIAPHGKRRRYVYPLPKSADGSSVAEHFDIDMRLSGAENDSQVKTPGYEMETAREKGAVRLHLAEDAFVPNGDLVLDYKPKNADSELRAWGFQGAAATPPGLTKGKKQSPKAEVLEEQSRLSKDSRGYALLSLRPTLPRWTEYKSHDYVLVLDSSQSMVGERFQRAMDAATALVGEMDKRDRFRVLACDLECRTFKSDAMNPSAQHARELEAWLGNIVPAGASYLEHALEEGARISGTGDAGDRERLVIYIGDGIASMGHRSLSVLSQTARTLRKEHETTFTSVGIGADSDSRVLGAIARAGGGFYIGHRSGRQARHLAQAVIETTMGVSLKDAELVFPKGMSDVSPTSLSTLRAGDEFILSGRYAEGIQGNVILRGTVGGKPYENTFALNLPMTSNPANAFVPKIWASQTIERLETEGRATSRDTIVALSKSYGVMSKQTSLLVLESEAMFKAFGVDRAKPLVQWTGEEGEADSSDSGGDINYGLLGGEVATAGGGKSGRASVSA